MFDVSDHGGNRTYQVECEKNGEDGSKGDGPRPLIGISRMQVTVHLLADTDAQHEKKYDLILRCLVTLAAIPNRSGSALRSR